MAGVELVRYMPWSPSIDNVKQRLGGPEEAKVEQNVFTSAYALQRDPGLQELVLYQP